MSSPINSGRLISLMSRSNYMVHPSPYATMILVFQMLCLVWEPNLNVFFGVISTRRGMPVLLQYSSACCRLISETEVPVSKQAPRNWFLSFFIMYTEKSSSIMRIVFPSSDSPSRAPSLIWFKILAKSSWPVMLWSSLFELMPSPSSCFSLSWYHSANSPA